MTRFLISFQILATMLQGTPDVINLFPHKYHPLFHFLVSAAQALAGYHQKNYNPDGSLSSGNFYKSGA